MGFMTGAGYAILLFVEASLGKTKYGSLAGLTIAGIKYIFNRKKENHACNPKDS